MATAEFLVEPVNVIPASKFNKKIDPKKLFIAGQSIVDSLKTVELQADHINGSAGTQAGRRRARRQVDNEVAVHLNESFSKIDHIPGMKTTLYPHQQTAVKAMLDLEYARDTQMVSTVMGSAYKVSYNAAVLSEPVGSGKTIDALAVIMMSKIPRAVPDIMELAYPKGPSSNGYIRRKFKKFLRPTLIFVGVSVMKQWERAIREFTDLKVYKVNTIVDLRPLLGMITDGSINEYDIILVKNGKFTVEIELPTGISIEDKNKVSQPYFYNILANFRQYCWARVFVDDFDTIRLPHNAGIVNGIFTWYISSTRKRMEFRGAGTNTAASASEILRSFDYGCANIMYNHFLFRYLNVRNDIAYLKATTAIPNPKYWIASFENPNNKYISLLSGINDDQVNQIAEMLNGDAIGAAAEAAGIKSTSVANIFEKILGGKFQQYRFSGDLLSFIEHCNESEPTWLPMNQNPDDEDRYGKRDLIAFREIEYKYPGVKKLLESTEEEYTEVKKQTGVAIQRVKDNIKTGKCPICRDDLADADDTAIAKCCGTIFCGNCAIEGQNLKDRYRKLNGRCSKCRAQITIKDLIYMENFDLSKIENEDFEDEEDAAPAPVVAKAKSKPITKYTAIIDIIQGNPVPNSRRVDMYIPNMMKGGAYLQEAKVRKVLIFANYDETLKHIIKELDEEKIHYWRLMGSSTDIDQVATAFTRCNTTCALVVNSTKHCSGLNLQTATDLVFAHSIIDPAIESQVAGRGHRLGRKNPLNIWYMQYDNEVAQLEASHGVRNMSQDELNEERKRELGETNATIADVKDNSHAGFSEGKTKDHRNERNAPKFATKKKLADSDDEDEEEEADPDRDASDDE